MHEARRATYLHLDSDVDAIQPVPKQFLLPIQLPFIGDEGIEEGRRPLAREQSARREMEAVCKLRLASKEALHAHTICGTLIVVVYLTVQHQVRKSL